MQSNAIFNLILQFCLVALTHAAPIADETFRATWNSSATYGTGGGIVGFIVLVLDIIVWIEVLKSNRPPLHKLLWCLLVFIFPIVGVIIYYLFSNRAAHGAGAGYEPIG